MTVAIRLCTLLLALAAVSVRADSLDDFYQRVIKERNVPSTTVAVVKDGKLVKVGAYGTADLERGIPARHANDLVWRYVDARGQTAPGHIRHRTTASGTGWEGR